MEKEKGEAGVGEGEEEEEEVVLVQSLKPWEQHATVISIPRFDYRAPSSLLERSHSGFLITCPIKREKSATKEAISILEKYACCMSDSGFEKFEPSDATVDGKKKRKLCFEEVDAEHVESAERNEAADIVVASDKVAKEASPSSGAYENAKRSLILSLVKLTRSGLLLFTFPSNDFHTVDMLSNIFHSMGSGKLKPPLWCHRIFPIQETCILKEKDMQIVVSKLVQQYMGVERDKLEKPIKFAVGYNRRGIDETEIKFQKTTIDDSKRLALLDRDTCFKVVAGAVQGIATNSVVDLKSPELVVLVELLPISGVPLGSLLVGISILPHDLVTTKPRLCVKSLISDTKATKRSS